MSEPGRPMLHIATSHTDSSRWIEIQLRQLREHIALPYTTWASLALADGARGAGFDHVLEQKGPEAGRLNHLAVEISQVAAEDDLLMFLAPDAFPLADPMPMVQAGLQRAALVAVRRDENAGDPQPYPCFCVTTIGAWRGLAGDWSDGYPWTARGGARVTDLGGNLLRRLELTGTEWVALTRSSPALLDPLFFAVYGDVIYHHGAGLLGRAHLASAPRPLPVGSMPGLGGIARRVDAERAGIWERLALRRMRRSSEAIHTMIARQRPGWPGELRAGCPRLGRD